MLHQWYLQRRKHYLVLVKESSESGAGNIHHEADNENNVPIVPDQGLVCFNKHTHFKFM